MNKKEGIPHVGCLLIFMKLCFGERILLFLIELLNSEESAGDANERIDTENNDVYLLFAALGKTDTCTRDLKCTRYIHLNNRE